MNGQHDDHCWITFMYRNWKIADREGDLLELRDPVTGDGCWLDIGEVRWDEYEVAAIRMMKEAGL